MSVRDDCPDCTEETICRKHFIVLTGALLLKSGLTGPRADRIKTNPMSMHNTIEYEYAAVDGDEIVDTNPSREELEISHPDLEIIAVPKPHRSIIV